MDQRPPPDSYYGHHPYSYQPYGGMPAPPYYDGRHTAPVRYSPYARPGQHYGGGYNPGGPEFDGRGPYPRASGGGGLPEPSQQDLPSAFPRYQPPSSPHSCARSPSIETNDRISPIMPDPPIGVSQKDWNKHLQNEKRKKRNREAQRKARDRQKKMIETLNLQLTETKKENLRLQAAMQELMNQIASLQPQTTTAYQPVDLPTTSAYAV